MENPLIDEMQREEAGRRRSSNGSTNPQLTNPRQSSVESQQATPATPSKNRLKRITDNVETFFTTPDALDEQVARSSSKRRPPSSSSSSSNHLEQQLLQHNGATLPPTPSQAWLPKNSSDGNGNGNENTPTADLYPPEDPLQAAHNTLVSSGSREFTLRHTLAYWVAIAFATGSLMFLLGGVATIYHFGDSQRNGQDERSYESSFVTAPYVVGSFFYTLGCYAGFLAVINLARKDAPPPGLSEHPFRFWAVMRTRRPWWANVSSL